MKFVDLFFRVLSFEFNLVTQFLDFFLFLNSANFRIVGSLNEIDQKKQFRRFFCLISFYICFSSCLFFVFMSSYFCFHFSTSSSKSLRRVKLLFHNLLTPRRKSVAEKLTNSVKLVFSVVDRRLHSLWQL